MNNKNEKHKLSNILHKYKDSSFETKLQAQFAFFLCCVLTIIMLPIIAYTVVIALFLSEAGHINVMMMLSEISMVFFFSIALMLIVNGFLKSAAHLLFISAFSCIWFVMSLDREGLLEQLDTVILVAAVISMLPIFFEKAILIFFYAAANITALILFVFFKFQSINASLADYIADTSITIIFIAIVGYNLIRIKKALLEKSENEVVKLRKIERELSMEKEKLIEANKLIESVTQAQKLQSLGTLAGGIAHDFNNLLTGIYGHIGFATDLSSEDNVKELLIQASNTIERAKSLTRQLLTFSKGGDPVKELHDPGPFLLENVKFILSGSNCSSSFNISENLKKVEFDRHQLAQVVDNLILNAVQAMPGGGTIRVRAENILMETGGILPLNPGEYVKISISDEGCGIPESDIPKIFDPFFTRKNDGQGLGLAMCYSIISRHKGIITVDSTVGEGSTFHVFIPATNHIMAQKVQHEGPQNKNVLFEGRILIMDDERIVSSIIAKTVGKLGFEAVIVDKGEDAVSEFMKAQKEGKPFSAVIFDLTVPNGMGGQEAIKKIREINTTVPAFVSTGYSEDPVVANPNKYGFNDSISKPFEVSELEEKLRKHL